MVPARRISIDEIYGSFSWRRILLDRVEEVAEDSIIIDWNLPSFDNPMKGKARLSSPRKGLPPIDSATPIDPNKDLFAPSKYILLTGEFDLKRILNNWPIKDLLCTNILFKTSFPLFYFILISRLERRFPIHYLATSFST